jgi:hypothetical protein
MQNKNLQIYLDHIGWNKEQFTPDRLEIMLVASCLRFLGGLTELDFVLEFSEEICKKQKENISLPLRYATAILHDLAEELNTTAISPKDKNTIEKNIDNAQEVITKRKYLLS